MNKHAKTKGDQAQKKVAYLTFDDGPKLVTKRILRTLQRHKVKATFFMLEPQIRQWPGVAQRIVRNGHAVGLHGVTHQVSVFYASSDSVLSEFNQTRRTLREVTGKDTVLVRAPYGSVPYMKPAYLKAVEQAGYRLWDWNVDSDDWRYPSAQFVSLLKKRIIKQSKSDSKLIILLHDKPATARYLPRIIRFLRHKGYVFRRLNATLTPVTR
ncbi:polysaccharide deacetylase family protein [Paenibacillus sp. 481]|uniref:polysaccharide deacetylase family protein n=1 Tax=Paenibacillus sp. 481 TaxID=2835869 RepID=UPI001E3626F6|nr:polysaccharide deacetylase family protein [Paenibacillus sp. 481]UHA75480.1 polysaccharide deacetylase [Paenibacillus sp. 481]